MVDREMGDSTRPVKRRHRLSLKASRQRNVTPTQTPLSNSNSNAARVSPNKASRESKCSVSTTSVSSLSSTDGSTSVSTNVHSSVSSLSSTEGSTSVSTNVHSSVSSLSSTEGSTSVSSNVHSSRVPAVASLENLGNTCFMNSVMQILRYTPGFLNNLALLYQDIQGSEKIKRKHKTDHEQTSFEEDNSKRCWRVVKNVYKMYKDLSTLEEKYEEVASDDVMSMSVKPLRILQAIKELNPMYEGHMQHDAQEFLRCFLCYFQDGEKEVQKFYSQLPQKFSPKINPIMQRFLTCSKTSQETKDKIVKIVNDISDSQEETGNAIEAEKVKVNLFPKSEVKTGAVVSPRKVQVTPKLGNTTDIVVEVDRKVTLDGAVAKACGTMLTAPVDVGDYGHCELHDSTGKQQRGKSTARRGKRYKPHDNSRQGLENKKNFESKSHKLHNQRKGKGAAEIECRQLSITDMFGITYSSKKKLGMRGVVLKKSAEELFDELKRAEQSDSYLDIQNEDSSPATYTKGNETSELDSNCDMEVDTQKSSMSNVAWSPPESEGQSLEELGDKPSTKNMSSSETSVDCKENKEPTCCSYQDVFCAFLSDIPDDDSDSLEVQSDSSSEDIILTKKREKELRETPRRSPRKLASEVYQSSARKYKLSMSASCSKSESSIDKFQHKLEIGDVDGLQYNMLVHGKQSHSATSSNSPKIVQPLLVKSDQEEESETEMEVIDIRGEEEIVTTPVALVPIVKLENCDYILSGNAASVSAAYATKCLTPLKTRRRSSSSSGNYLKQRSQLLSMDISDEEEFRKALTEMLSSPVKSRSKYDLIERTFQGTMMLRTRCLECESSRERREEFHDVSVPVRIEKCDSDIEDGFITEDEKENKCDLLDLIEASTEVERLVEENKYFCDGCKAYVEAERSVHYDVMPDILTLHLKRFSSQVGNPGNIMKINDHVDIPLSLPCLRYRCTQPCLRLDHRYRLYGIVTHSGMTLTSGHYLAYVRTLPNQPAEAMSKQHGLLRNSDNQFCPSIENSVRQENKTRPTTRRKMGVVTKPPSRFDDNVITNIKVKAFEAVAAKKMKPDLVASLLPSNRFDSEWFECDDETIRVFDESEIVELLSKKCGSLLGTPYLLFYHKSMC